MDIESILKNIKKIEPITTGKSNDKKYLLVLKNGTLLFERVGPISRYDRFKMMYDELIDLKRLNEPGVPIPYFVTKEDDTAVLLTSYSKGIPLNEVITDKNCSLDRVKELGRKAGNLLASVHTLSPLVPTDSGDYDVLFKNILSDYVNLSLYLKHEQDMISFVLNHMKEVMTARPITYIHGNFDERILLVSPTDRVFFVDTCDISSFDPFYDFKNIGVITRFENIEFAKSIIDSYTQGHPTDEFWLAFELYNAFKLMSTTIELIKEGKEKEAIDKFETVADDFHGFKEDEIGKPKWY